MKRKLLVLVCLLMVCCLVPLNGLAVRWGQVVRITNSGSVNVRSGPGTSYESIGSAQPENIYPYLGSENGWHHIRYTLGVEGYVSANKTTLEPGLVQDEIGTGEYVDAVVRITHTNSLNIRSGPSKSYSAIDTAYPDETYPYIGPDNGWNIIQLANGEYGYVAGNRTEVEVVGGSSSFGQLEEISGATPPVQAQCGVCGGDGLCTTCDASAYVYSKADEMYIACPSCLGDQLCWLCHGTGVQ